MESYLLCWWGTAYFGWSSWYHLLDSGHRPRSSTLPRPLYPGGSDLGVEVSMSTLPIGPGSEASGLAPLPPEILESLERLGSWTLPPPATRDWLPSWEASAASGSGMGLEMQCWSGYWCWCCCCCCWRWCAAETACSRWRVLRWLLWSEFSLLRDSVSSWLRRRPDDRRCRNKIIQKCHIHRKKKEKKKKSAKLQELKAKLLYQANICKIYIMPVISWQQVKHLKLNSDLLWVQKGGTLKAWVFRREALDSCMHRTHWRHQRIKTTHIFLGRGADLGLLVGFLQELLKGQHLAAWWHPAPGSLPAWHQGGRWQRAESSIHLIFRSCLLAQVLCWLGACK